ncbi:hypothetical protein Zmor_000227 [Zophobas morio]|uniref:Uncharacterized protein n=1 Tax=Zophobas morio TaxID=2755281 RepID=A0AA38J419_9CUCU|nr:hypothetical protein Zmor_000227 [Zophobas morio]
MGDSSINQHHFPIIFLTSSNVTLLKEIVISFDYFPTAIIDLGENHVTALADAPVYSNTLIFKPHTISIFYKCAATFSSWINPLVHKGFPPKKMLPKGDIFSRAKI